MSTKNDWFPHGKRNNSFTGSFKSESFLEPKDEKHMLNPKLLEKVIQTINQRPSEAMEFHEDLAKAATQTWNAHLSSRKKMTRKLKVVEDIASSLGLAKGFRNEFHDEAERLVSLLFKEISKKEPKVEEEHYTEESTESTLEEEFEEIEFIEGIESIEEIVEEPVSIPPPKPPMVTAIKIEKPRSLSHQHPSPYITYREKATSLPAKLPVQVEKDLKTSFSFLNVKKIRPIFSGEYKPMQTKTVPGKIIERTYMEIKKNTFEAKGKQPKKILAKTNVAMKEQDMELMKTVSPIIKRERAKSFKAKSPANLASAAGVLKFLDIKGWDTKEGILKQSETVLPTEKPFTLKKSSRRISESSRGMFQDKVRLSGDSDTSSEPRSRQTIGKTEGPKEDQFYEKTKQFVTKQIREALSMLVYPRRTSPSEYVKQKQRERKSIFVLWKNYFDIRHSVSVGEEQVEIKKMRRDSLMRAVDKELMKTSLYSKLYAYLEDMTQKSPYERNLWRYLNEKANQISEGEERMYSKQLEHTIQVLDEQVKKSEPPKDVLLEEEKRRKALDDHLSRVDESRQKSIAKRPNTKETTMEEILQMRGFRGRPRNCKSTIWIKKPDFIGYLKPMKRTPKNFYDPTKSNFMIQKYVGASRHETKTPSTESSRDSYKVTISRKPIFDKMISEPTPEVPMKRHTFANTGFRKYFGSLDVEDEDRSMDIKKKITKNFK
ncbi:uncharacterized protein [Halyomorpha halys]|uniref:uncharacterized protein n=1 Tax=Halyomorpha halys TaxID=286706 RepID=UPI0006D4F4FF|nr:pinin-like [Halyomorpha halys]